MILGVLIFVHELGHFVVAKWANIYVERFSIGFGRRLFGKRVGETDYCISALPLGGYVRMAGQSDVPQEVDEGEVQLEEWEANVPEERRFTSKRPMVRAAVLLAGPAMNGLFGMAVYPLVFMLGQQVPSYTQDTRVSEPFENAPAQQAGILLGDRILSLNGNKVDTWEKLITTMIRHADQSVSLQIEREEQVVNLDVTPTRFEGAEYPSIGVMPFLPATIGEIMEGWPAEQAALRPGDLITRANGELVDRQKLARLFRDQVGEDIEISVRRDTDEEFTVAVVPKKVGMVESALFNVDMPEIVDTVLDKSTQWRKGDKIVAIDGAAVKGEEVQDLIRKKPNVDVRFTVERTRLFKTTEIEIAEALADRGMIGLVWDQSLVTLQYPPGKAIVRGIVASVRSSRFVITVIRRLMARDIEMKSLSGPIGIYYMTREAMKIGPVTVLQFMAILSFNFFILNLLPIPVLDGGQLVLVGTEAVIRRPVGIRMQIWLQRLGIAMLLLLMTMVFYNDIVKTVKGIF
jgi:regulator of sigma E protease